MNWFMAFFYKTSTLFFKILIYFLVNPVHTVSFFLCGFLMIFKTVLSHAIFVCLKCLRNEWIKIMSCSLYKNITFNWWYFFWRTYQNIDWYCKISFWRFTHFGYYIKKWISYYVSFVSFLSLWWQYSFNEWFAWQNIIF